MLADIIKDLSIILNSTFTTGLQNKLNSLNNLQIFNYNGPGIITACQSNKKKIFYYKTA